MLGRLVQGVHGLATLDDRSGVEILVTAAGVNALIEAAHQVLDIAALGAVGGGAHTDHEYLVVDAMAERAHLVAGLVRAILDA
jgi:glutamate carboxypeptidase